MPLIFYSAVLNNNATRLLLQYACGYMGGQAANQLGVGVDWNYEQRES